MGRRKRQSKIPPGPLVTSNSGSEVQVADVEDNLAALENVPDIYKHDSNGVRSYFRMTNDGTLELVDKRTLRPDGMPGKRKFRLRPLSIAQISIGQRERSYSLNPGAGKRKLKWTQRNSVRDKKRDPKKETVHEVDDEIARRLETMPETFEEVYT